MCARAEGILQKVADGHAGPHIFFAATYYKRCSAKHLHCLVAILDVASRKVLAFRLSSTLSADFCVEALEEALAKFGAPEIFNTDQGSQFTSDEWIKVLDDAGVAISMDGKGRWIDNVFIERLWRSVKYEEVYLHGYTNGTEARNSLTKYFSF